MSATLRGWMVIYVMLVINHLVPMNTACSNCPFQWSEFNGHCYWMVTQRMSFQDAENNCRNRFSKLGRQSHLMSVTSPEENAFLRNYTSDVLGKGHWAVWIGLNDRTQQGDFAWSDGSGAPYRDFGPNEPNHGYNEYCVALWYVNHWNDFNCAAEIQSICKMPGKFLPD